ncbi:hypothetical protein [Azospirillum sp. A1-3]|nr:hypothetical protein [Azospirillum sp. A1-3]
MLDAAALVNAPDHQTDSSLPFNGAPFVKGSGGWTFDIIKTRAE